MLFLNGKLVKYILLNIDVKQKTKQKQNKCYCPNVGHVIIEQRKRGKKFYRKWKNELLLPQYGLN